MIQKMFFGNLTIKRGDEHTYVGMKFKIRDDKKVEISMPDHIKACIPAFREEIKGGISTPAKHYLFKAREGEMTEQLGPEKSELFHHIISKLRYVSRRARLEIDLAISYLCNRTTKSDKGD